jgi:hypothetical protein
MGTATLNRLQNTGLASYVQIQCERLSVVCSCVALVGLLLLTPLSAANAAVIGANVTPGSRSVAISQTTSVNVTWTVINSPLATSTTSTISSIGIFAAICSSGSPLLPTPLGIPANSAISNTVATTGTTALHTISETVIVPPELVQRARAAGLTSFYFLRHFAVPPAIEQNDPGVNACVRLDITGSGGAGFTITQEALSFDDGTPVRIVSRGVKVQAQAELNYSGVGLLQAVWEIATPASTAGEPFYQPIAQVTQSLVNVDGQTIKSPLLPTQSTGLYLVRLRITDPVADYESPVIRYFVGDGQPGKELPATQMTLLGPAPAALYLPGGTFAWQAIQGARAYKLEIYRTGKDTDIKLPDIGVDTTTPDSKEIVTALSQPLVTGMLVPARQTQIRLSPHTQMRLEPGKTYLWRVLAIGVEGNVIGQSPLRKLRVP